MTKEILYILPIIYVLYISYKKKKTYELIFVPIIILSYLGTTKVYSRWDFAFQFIVVVLISLLLLLLLYLYYKEYKEVKLQILQEKRDLRKKEKEILKSEPSRRQKIVIEDLRTHEKKVYWASPTIGERYKKETDSKCEQE